MAGRATWKGILQISRVTIPIKVFPATAPSETLAFNQLHGECQTRVTQRKWCTACGRTVASTEIVKGFEFEKGRYVVLLDDELDAVKPPSTRVIDLVQFAKATALDPIYVDRSYYLAPDGPLAGDAYAVICEAIAGLVGIGKLALYGREYLVAVRAQQDALVLHTLHHAAEIRSHDALEAPELAAAVVPFSQVKTARQVIAALTGPLNLASFTDAYQADVRLLIDAKIAGEEIVVAPVQTPTMLGFREALTVSLQAVRATTKKPAAAAAPKRAKAS